MKSTTLTNSIDNLREKDLYSIVLYAIYKFTNDENYHTLSELIYSVNKDSLLNMCSIFGGQTITIPTIEQLKVYTNALLLYTMTQKGEQYSKAIGSLALSKSARK